MTPLQAVIWDMDGVLVDSNDLHFQAWVATYREFGDGQATLSRSAFEAVYGMRNTETVAALFGAERATPEFTAAVTKAKETSYRASLPGHLRPVPGVLAWLAFFHERGLRQAVASSGSRLNIDTSLAEIGAAGFFAVIVSGESDGVPRGKPAPDIFLEAARRLEVAPADCLVVEDSLHGVQAAHAAGMPCLAVATTHPVAHLSVASWAVGAFTDLTPDQFLVYAGMAFRS